jgi:succinate dehydrogenase/fumarate reductase-like Fe-S protein
MLKRLYSYALLGWRAVLWHPVKNAFKPDDEKGKARFLKNYAPEGLVPYSPEERARLPEYMKCVACGFCDAVCPLLREAPRAAFPGPMRIALAHARATPDLVHVREAVARADACVHCTACQDACPRGVPLKEMFSFARRKLDEVERWREQAKE